MARDYGSVQRREGDALVELLVAEATPVLPPVHDESLVCVRHLRFAVVTTPSECFGRGDLGVLCPVPSSRAAVPLSSVACECRKIPLPPIFNN